VTLVVEEKKPFQISGAAPTELVPGQSAPVDLLLTNPHSFPLQVTELNIVVDNTTSDPACDGPENFSVTAIPAGDYPLTLPANSSRTLSSLTPAPQLPTVGMTNLTSTDQDACKDVSFNLHYSGTATR
jgi:hypothetical protein